MVVRPGERLSRAASSALTVGLLLTCLVGLAYGPFLASPFVFDDYHSVVDNPAIRTLRGIPDFFTTGKGFSLHAKWHAYRPLLLTSYALSYVFTGPDPWSFRIVSFFLHVCNGLIVFLLLRRLAGPGGAGAALAGAVLFTLHPGQTQAVMYVSSRSELLAAGCTLLALLFFLRGIEESEPAGRKWLRAWLPTAVAFFLAMCSKESAVLFLPAALLVALATVPDLSARQLSRVAACLAPFVLLYALHTRVARALVLAAARSGEAVPGAAPADAAAAVGAHELGLRLAAFGVYPRLTVLPYPLSIFHQLPEDGPPFAAAVILSSILLAALVGGAVFARLRRQPLLALALGWFPAVLVPYFFATVNMKVNENRLYLALFGLSVLAVDLLRRSTRRPGFAAATLAVVLGLCLFGTVARNRQWADAERFWLNEVATAPDYAWPYENLAQFYDRQGRADQALRTFQMAVTRKWADLGLAHNYFGLRLVDAGRAEEARAHFEKAVAFDGAVPDYLSNLGIALAQLGRHEEAERYFLRALSLTPCFAKAQFNLAVTYWERGRRTDAEEWLRKALACNDYYPMAHAELGKILFSRGDRQQALSHLERAATLGSNDPDLYFYLARARAREGSTQAALAALERALLLDPRWAAQARTEADFEALRALPLFRSLVGDAGRVR